MACLIGKLSQSISDSSKGSGSLQFAEFGSADSA
jgi:hypothetical protein